jgi:hypothetical protein
MGRLWITLSLLFSSHNGNFLQKIATGFDGMTCIVGVISLLNETFRGAKNTET